MLQQSRDCSIQLTRYPTNPNKTKFQKHSLIKQSRLVTSLTDGRPQWEDYILLRDQIFVFSCLLTKIEDIVLSVSHNVLEIRHNAN